MMVTSCMLIVAVIVLMVGLIQANNRYQRVATEAGQVKAERDELVHKDEQRMLSSNDEINVDILSSQIHREVNRERQSKGLKPLTYLKTLEHSACAKARDKIAKDYWDHVSPDGKQPWHFIQNEGLTYTRAGENLAYGYRDSVAVVRGWMDSRSHRENLLGDFTHQGICVQKYFKYQGESYRGAVVVQHLIKP